MMNVNEPAHNTFGKRKVLRERLNYAGSVDLKKKRGSDSVFIAFQG